MITLFSSPRHTSISFWNGGGNRKSRLARGQVIKVAGWSPRRTVSSSVRHKYKNFAQMFVFPKSSGTTCWIIFQIMWSLSSIYFNSTRWSPFISWLTFSTAVRWKQLTLSLLESNSRSSRPPLNTLNNSKKTELHFRKQFLAFRLFL